MTLLELEDRLANLRERGAQDDTPVFLFPFTPIETHDDALDQVRLVQAPDERPEIVLYAKELSKEL